MSSRAACSASPDVSWSGTTPLPFQLAVAQAHAEFGVERGGGQVRLPPDDGDLGHEVLAPGAEPDPALPAVAAGRVLDQAGPFQLRGDLAGRRVRGGGGDGEIPHRPRLAVSCYACPVRPFCPASAEATTLADKLCSYK
jgi:hypothetical protein